MNPFDPYIIIYIIILYYRDYMPNVSIFQTLNKMNFTNFIIELSGGFW